MGEVVKEGKEKLSDERRGQMKKISSGCTVGDVPVEECLLGTANQRSHSSFPRFGNADCGV